MSVKIITKGRISIRLETGIRYIASKPVAKYKVIMEDIITEEVKLESELFDDRKEALEYFSDLYDTL